MEQNQIWVRYFAWLFVLTIDEGWVLFRTVWRRKENGRWRYKTGRSDDEIDEEREFLNTL